MGVIVSLVVIIALVMITIWECAKSKFLWRFVPRNHLIPLDKGEGNPYDVLGDFEPSGYLRWFSLRSYGIHWMGWPPVDTHMFSFLHERANSKVGSRGEDDEKMPTDKWMVSDPEPVPTDHLLKTVIHWAPIYGVEFMGGQQADIFFQYEATVLTKEDAKVAVYDREGKFFQYLNAEIRSTTLNLERLRSMKYSPSKIGDIPVNKEEYFITANKDDDSDICKEILSRANRCAAKISGYTLKSIAVIDFRASSQAEEKLARLQQEADIRAAAALALAKGEIADVVEMVKAVKAELPNANDDIIMSEVSKIAVAHRYANSKNLQAVGGGAVVGLQPKEKKGRK